MRGASWSGWRTTRSSSRPPGDSEAPLSLPCTFFQSPGPRPRRRTSSRCPAWARGGLGSRPGSRGARITTRRHTLLTRPRTWSPVSSEAHRPRSAPEPVPRRVHSPGLRWGNGSESAFGRSGSTSLGIELTGIGLRIMAQSFSRPRHSTPFRTFMDRSTEAGSRTCARHVQPGTHIPSCRHASLPRSYARWVSFAIISQIRRLEASPTRNPPAPLITDSMD